MYLIKPKAYFFTATPKVNQLIERAGRVCYKSEEHHVKQYNKLLEEGMESKEASEVVTNEFITRILKRGHLSVIEHASATCRLIVDRGVSHEIVRHRLASFSQESSRYVNYGKHGCQFIIPPWTKLVEGKYAIYYDNIDNIVDHYHNHNKMPDSVSESDLEWLEMMDKCESSYNYLLDLGWRPEQARSILPNSTKTELFVTANMREWMHIFTLRTGKAAHPQMREIMMPILAYFREKWPVLFNNIGIVDEGIEKCEEEEF